MLKNTKQKEIVFFGTGAIGDFVMFVDMAIRANKAEGFESLILLKGNGSFLKTLVFNYPFIRVTKYSPLEVFKILVRSFFNSIYIIWETANSGYGKRVFFLFYFFYYFTPVRIVALQVKDEFSFLGVDAIKFKNDKYIYKIGIDMLEHIGLSVDQSVPHIDFIEDKYFLSDNNLLENYIVVCPTTSSFSEIKRTLPDRRWANIINTFLDKHNNYKVVFVGGKEDQKSFNDIIKLLDKNYSKLVLSFSGTLDAQQIMNVFSSASIFLGLRTGTTLIASCIKMKSKVILLDSKLKEFIWYYDFSENVISLSNKEECLCRENKIRCYVRDYLDNRLYHRCNYFIKDEKIIETIETFIK